MAQTVQSEPDDGTFDPDPTPAPPRPGALRELAEELRAVVGVATVVCESGQLALGAARGALAPLEEETLVLGRLARRVGDALDSGRPVVAVIQGSQRSLLMLQVKGGSVNILTKPGTRADSVHAEIRKIVAGRRP